MIETSFIRKNKEFAIAGLAKRNFEKAEYLVNNLIDLDDKRKSTQHMLDQLQAESNQLSKQIGQLMKDGKKEEAENIKGKTSSLKNETRKLSERLIRIEKDLTDILISIPNIPQDIVPVGNTEADNVIIYEWGETPELETTVPHWELIKKYGIIDFELGNKISGAGFPVYIGKGARIQRALANFFIDEALNQGYIEIQPPILINEDSGYGTGQLPDKEGQMYHVTNENLFLIPTAEVPITNLYRDQVLTKKELPIKIVGYTQCFRREAGSWGAHVRGLNRLHQFDKVEIVQIQEPENSENALNEMIEYVKSLLEKLNLQFRIVRLCAGDLGFTAAVTYDFEVFSAAQQKWLEVSSVSNFETFQTNRLKLRYKDEGKTRLLHTLNGSALAFPRILASIIENNQKRDSINIPEALIPYTGFDKIN